MKKNILVTGANGFIGSKLVPLLRDNHYNVFEFTHRDADISTAELPPDMDHVFHLAAFSSVPKSWETPAECYRVNVTGTANVLQYCAKHKCSITYISSYIYGKPQYLPIDEEHPMKPNSPYNHSKMLGEELCEFFHDTFGVPVVVFRPFNIFGENQSNSFLIPYIISQAMDSQKERIELKDLKPSRDYIYVKDVLSALMLSLDKVISYDVFNLVSGCSYSVKEAAEIILKILDIHKPIVSLNQERKNEVTNILGTYQHIEKCWGWKPRYSLKTGLEDMLSIK